MKEYLSPTVLWKGIFNTVRPKQNSHQPVVTKNVPSLNIDAVRVMASLFVRIAGISGATAVAMGAYGTHAFYKRPDVSDELKDVFRTANYYHFLHTLALLGVPLTKRPLITGSLIVAGMSIFCGTCYYYALSGHKSIGRFTPYGGTLLIVAWLSMMF